MANLNSIKRTGGRSKKRVGRGQSSGKGKTSGRGTKGQSARAGNKKRPEMRDIIKKLPKRRGFGKNRGRTVNPDRVQPVAVTLEKLDKRFDTGATIDPKALQLSGLVGRTLVPIKLIGTEVTKKFAVAGCTVSASAKAAIEKAGGSVA